MVDRYPGHKNGCWEDMIEIDFAFFCIVCINFFQCVCVRGWVMRKPKVSVLLFECVCACVYVCVI